MLSTIFYRISAVATNLRKNVEETFTPKTPVITSTEPVFIVNNTTSATPTLEHTPIVCETVQPTVSEACVNDVCTIEAPKLQRKYSIINNEENEPYCGGDCANCECNKVPDVEDCGLTVPAEPISEIKSTITRVCSKSACDCITNYDISCDKTEKRIDDISGNCHDSNNECCSDE
jgi:hypothetical protein